MINYPTVRATFPEWQVRVVVNRSALPQGALEHPAFWYVGFHDSDGTEIARADANREELHRLLAGGSEEIVLQRRFRSLRSPVGWSIHPADRRRTWLARLSGPVDAAVSRLSAAEDVPPLQSLARHLLPHRLIGGTKIRVGRDGDGGYVMLDGAEAGGPVYSFGVGFDVSWDLALAERGLTIHQYDHTVSGLPAEHPNFRFNRLGLAPDPSERFVSLASALTVNGDDDRQDMILKIDIEGAEWEILDSAPQSVLDRFRQILIEFHGLIIGSDDPQRVALHDRVLRKMNVNHAVHHIHGCNCGTAGRLGGHVIPDVIEVSYARRDLGEFVPSDESFPTGLDHPCHGHRPELILGRFRFD